VKLRVLSSLLLLFFPACQVAAQATSNAQKFSPSTRTFRFTYNFNVKDIPPERSECASGFRSCREFEAPRGSPWRNNRHYWITGLRSRVVVSSH
jgi:hypothetical protein